jgi:hypothetical protein
VVFTYCVEDVVLGLDGEYVCPRLDMGSKGKARGRYRLACKQPLELIKDSHHPTARPNDVAVVSTIVQDDLRVSEFLMVYKTVPQSDIGVYGYENRLVNWSI